MVMRGKIGTQANIKLTYGYEADTEEAESFLKLWLHSRETLTTAEMEQLLKRVGGVRAANRSGKQTICRRSLKDRRSWSNSQTIPFIDANGTEVTEDRRRIPDRRINNIEVEWMF